MTFSCLHIFALTDDEVRQQANSLGFFALLWNEVLCRPCHDCCAGPNEECFFSDRIPHDSRLDEAFRLKFGRSRLPSDQVTVHRTRTTEQVVIA